MSTSGGATWDQKDYTLNDGFALAYASGSVYQGGSWYDEATYRSNMAVFKSTDNGTTWTRRRLDADTGEVRAIAASPSNPSLLLAGGRHYDGSSRSSPRMYRSTNAGLDWAAVGTAVFVEDGDCVWGIVFDPVFPARVLAATSRGAFISTDAGITWKAPAQNVYSTCIAADAGIPGQFFLGSYSGVWRSTNYGASWQQINNGLPTQGIYCLTCDPVHRFLYAGSDGRGTVRLTLDPAVDVPPDPGNAKPAAFALEQNYPNPFNPKTSVKWQVASGGEAGTGGRESGVSVKLSVYDLLGREVAVLVNERKAPGSYEVQFDGTGLASGVYICRMTAGTFVQSRRMLLIR